MIEWHNPTKMFDSLMLILPFSAPALIATFLVSKKSHHYTLKSASSVLLWAWLASVPSVLLFMFLMSGIEGPKTDWSNFNFDQFLGLTEALFALAFPFGLFGLFLYSVSSLIASLIDKKQL